MKNEFGAFCYLPIKCLRKTIDNDNLQAERCVLFKRFLLLHYCQCLKFSKILGEVHLLVIYL
jgi:hypothetical protein